MKKGVGIWWKKIRAEPWMAILISLLAVLSLVLLAVVTCDDPQWIYPRLGVETTTGKKSEALKSLGIGIGGLLLALQALMFYKRAKAMEDNVETTERGQRQGRLKNAIEHLGHESDSVRLGGAYELFHLAQDILELRQTVLDILCAHVRRTTGEPEYREKHQSKPSEEIRSLLTLLFVQNHTVFTGLHINLQESWLNGSDLDQARLGNAVLVRAQLHGAQLRGAQLHGANLWEARLHGAQLMEAQLHGAQLRGAQLHGANLWEARLHGAQLMGAQLHGAQLMGAQLHGAQLMGAQLHGARLWGARLHGASSDMRDFPESFEASIKEWINAESTLDGAIFAGGLTQEDVDSIGTGLSDEEAKKLRENLAEHIGGRESYELPENSGAIPGTYTAAEAAQWIAEYKTATKAVSGSS